MFSISLFCRGCSCQWSWSQTLTKPNQTKLNQSFQKLKQTGDKTQNELLVSAAGEDLVPEPPLQAQAAGEGEGNDGDAGRVGIVATQVGIYTFFRAKLVYPSIESFVWLFVC